MTKDEFAAIKGREKAATEGPWKWHKGDSYNAFPMVYAKKYEFAILDTGCSDYPGRDENAEFVAHARSDVPVLIAEIERLREPLQFLLERCSEVGPGGHLQTASIAETCRGALEEN